MIFDLLDNLNADCNFTEKIKESSYVESVTTNPMNTTTTNPMNTNSKSYHNLVSCIISEFDPIFQTFVAVPSITSLTESEKKLYLSQKIMEICSKIDEDTSYFRDYGFNEKIMKSHLIQQGLQMHEKKVNHISSVYYLNEFYKKHFVITHQNIGYETTLKIYPKIYLSIQGNHGNNRVKIIDEKEFTKGNLNELFDKIHLVNDIKKEMKSVYKMFLDPISKYKMDSLKGIAQDCNLSLKDDPLGKNKVKGQLYDEINLYKLNE